MMRERRAGLLAALSAAAALLAGACGVANAGEESVADKDALVIGVNTDQPGLSSQEGGGAYAGFDVDVAREIARRLGATVAFRPVTSATRETRLRSGDVDLVVASYSITPQRKTLVAFAGPYYVAHQDILVRGSDAGAVKNVRDLEGRRLCHVRGSVSYPRVQEEKGVAVLPADADGYDHCLQRLSAGELDAVSTDDLILAGLAAKAAKEGRGGPPLRIVNAPISDEPYGVGIARGDLDGCEAVNRAITGMYQDGTAARLLKTWFGPSGLRVTTTVPQFEGCD
ncbi:transporter substrate-binding domain-containing protein [Actinomadura rugatobispora]|uniref:Transporter substrate-binding domain-containing protein n=1 Tax=Actinomadura rugatobispora TaxID=1994 RepID=A0ABW1AFM3_9ACTN